MVDKIVPAPAPGPNLEPGHTLEDLPCDEFHLALLPGLTKRRYRLLKRKILAGELSPVVHTLNGRIVLGIEGYNICKRFKVPYRRVNIDSLVRSDIMMLVLDEARRRAPHLRTWWAGVGEGPAVAGVRATARLLEDVRKWKNEAD